MTRHRFDFISFFFGILFAGIAAWSLLIEEPADFGEIRWLWPAFLVVAGLGVLANVALRGNRRERPAVAEAPVGNSEENSDGNSDSDDAG